MKATIYTKSSSGKTLELVDIDPPVPKSGEVVIKVRAASVNPLDWRLKKPRPGVDVAGEVEAIGKALANASGDSAAQKVWSQRGPAN